MEERRGAVWRPPAGRALRRGSGGAGLLAAALLAGLAGAAESCEAPEGFTARDRLASKDVVVMFRTLPEAIEIGRHFSVEAVVCATPPTRGLRVDARMPEHRHGMNYRPTVAAVGPATTWPRA